MKSIKKLTILLPLVVLCMMIIGASPVSAASSEFLSSSSDAGITVTSSTGYTLMDGVREGDVTFKTNGTYVNAHVVLVKANAKASFKPVIPGYYTSGSKKSQRQSSASSRSWKYLTGVTNMVREYQSAADTNKTVLAAINGDFGIGYKARGSVIMEGGTEIVGAGYEDEYFFGHKSTTGTLNILGRTSSQKSTFDEAICGGAHILRNGQLFGVDNETEARQRTSIGVKNNGDTLLVCVESGISVKQLAQLMRDSGCWNAINMDGGGSITMVTKRSGDSNTVRRTPACTYSDIDGNKERRICSALMLVADDKVANNVGTVSGSSVTTDKTTYTVGDDVYVTASSDSNGSWVSILKADDSTDAGEYFWYYTYGNNGSTWCWENGTKNNIYEEGMCSLREGVTATTKLPPGTYRAAVLNYNSAGTGYRELASSYFTIKADGSTPYVLNTDKSVYTVGEKIMVTATRPSGDTGAWVGIVKSGKSISGADGCASYFWDYVPGDGSAFSLLEAENMVGEGDYAEYSQEEQALIDRDNCRLNPGTYDVILLTYDGYTVAEYNGQKVIKTIEVVGQDAEYNITYKDGSNTLTTLSPTTYKRSASQSGAISLPTNVNKEGYNFVGWYDNANFSGSPVTAIPKGSTGDKVYYAKFSKKTVEVIFDTGDGQSTVLVPYGDALAAYKPANPTKDGYTFNGWVTTSGGSTAFNMNAAIKSKTTVYAAWTKNIYAIVFDSDEGTSVGRIDYTIEDATFALPVPEKEGYDFLYWKDKATGETLTSIAKGTFGDKNLLAIWRNKTVFSMEKVNFAYGESIKITTYYYEEGAWAGVYVKNENPADAVPVLTYKLTKSGMITDMLNKAALDKYTGRPEAWYPDIETGYLKSGDYVIYIFDVDGNVKDYAEFHIAVSEDKQIVTPATCTTDGYTTILYTDGSSEVVDQTKAFGHSSTDAVYCDETYLCVSCGEMIPASAHVSSGKATCTEAEVCTVCKKVLTPSNGGHEWSEPNCTEAKKCIKCGETKGVALGHDWSVASCTEAKKCKVCNETEEGSGPLGHTWLDEDCFNPKRCSVCNETKGEKRDHVWDEGVVTTDPSCTEGGIRTFTCTLCKRTSKTEVEPKTGHDYKETIIEATCTTDGFTKYSCENCTDYYTDHVVKAHHTPGPAATCLEPQTCTKCPAVLAGVTDHNWGAEATCTTMQTCTVCGMIREGAKGHQFSSEPTCSVPQTCTRCNVEFTVDHIPGPAATCESAQTCTECDYVFKKALEHTPGAKATCTTPQACTKCLQVIADPLGHKPGADATCENGQSCERCSIELKGPTGHDVVVQPGKEATCTSTGLTEGKYCKTCGELFSIQTVINKKAHSATETDIKQATMSSDGRIVYKCVCGLEMYSESIASIGSVKLSSTSVTYSGKTKAPSISVKDSNGNVISSDYYTVEKPAGRKLVGVYTYKITFKDRYAGTKSLKLTIKPAKPTILTPKAASKAVTVKWKKVSKQTSGYQVMIATNKNFTKGKKTATVKGYKTVSKKISKLSAKKTYYVKVRSYKIVNGKKIYSGWSSIKTVKTK